MSLDVILLVLAVLLTVAPYALPLPGTGRR